jgi:hypothetical protein
MIARTMRMRTVRLLLAVIAAILFAGMRGDQS